MIEPAAEEIQQWCTDIVDNPQMFDKLATLLDTSPGSDALEAIYWDYLKSHDDAQTIAKHVLQRLDYAGCEQLLQIDAKYLRPLHSRLSTEAHILSAALNLSTPEWHEIRHHPVLLPEIVLEGQGHHQLAAAMYAIGYEQLNVSYELQLFTQAALRFKLAHVLNILDDSDQASQQQLKFLEPALSLLDKIDLLSNIPADNKNQLRFHIQEWAGIRYKQLKCELRATL